MYRLHPWSWEKKRRIDECNWSRGGREVGSGELDVDIDVGGTWRKKEENRRVGIESWAMAFSVVVRRQKVHVVGLVRGTWTYWTCLQLHVHWKKHLRSGGKRETWNWRGYYKSMFPLQSPDCPVQRNTGETKRVLGTAAGSTYLQYEVRTYPPPKLGSKLHLALGSPP